MTTFVALLPDITQLDLTGPVQAEDILGQLIGQAVRA